MATQGYIKVGGAWETIDNCKIKASGSWRQVDTIYIKTGGVWEQTWTRGVVTLTDATIQDPGSVGRAWLYLRSDGTVDKFVSSTTTQINSSTDWIIPNSADKTDFEAKWTAVGDDQPNEITPGWTTGVYADLTSDLKVGYTAPINDTVSGTVTVTIRRKSDNQIMDTADYTMSATNITV